VERLLSNRGEYDAMALARNPYGDGTAAQQIMEVCAKVLTRRDAAVATVRPGKHVAFVGTPEDAVAGK
jgi:UDP-N-acetylglucosamine 2-epimerase